MKLKEITIELTQQCPNCCVYCSSLSSPSMRTYLSAEQIERTIDDAIELGAKSINLSGGEPFLYPQILKIIDYIYKQGVDCMVYTSGITLYEGKPISIPNEILKRTKGIVSKLIVNIEAAEERVYNHIMGTDFGGFSLMQETIRNAVALGVTVEAHMVPMKVNYLHIPEVVNLCVDLGVTQLSFLRLVAQGRAMDNLRQVLLDKEELETAKRLMKEAAERQDIKIRLGVPFRDGAKRINCLTGICKLDVRYDGKVYPCEAFKNDNLKRIAADADNVKDESLREIYHSSDYLKQVRTLLANFQTEQTCETCMNQYYTRND